MKFLKISMVVLVVLGVILRAWAYWLFPVVGETQDEYAWSILGSSLLQTGSPVSWSYFAGYNVEKILEFHGAQFQLVKPALDHPPLFALIPGFFQTLSGAQWDEIVSIKIVRLPMVMLGSVNLVLFALWLWLLPEAHFGKAGKLFALGVFATAPSFVYLSRLVVSENLIVTFLLLLLLAKELPRKFIWLELLAVFLLPLTKISGIAAAAGEVLASMATKRNWQRSLMLLVLSGIALLLYVSAYDFRLFLEVQMQQAGRDVGLLAILSAHLWQPRLVEKLFADIWIPVGYLTTAAWLLLAAKDKPRNIHLSFLILTQLAFMLVSVGESTVHGWYRIVLLPFFAFTTGWAAEQVWKNKNWFGLTVAWFFALPAVRLAAVATSIRDFFAMQAMLVRPLLFFAGLHTLAVLFTNPLVGRLWRWSIWILVLVLLSSNIVTVLFLREQAYWLDAIYLEEGIRP